MRDRGKRHALSARQAICVQHVPPHPLFVKGAFTVKQEQVFAFNVMLESIVRLALLHNWAAWLVLTVQLSQQSVLHVRPAHIVLH
jgi:hypothetical protein